MSGDNSIIKNLDMLNLTNINLRKAENEVKDHLMSVKVMELKKFSFVPYSNILQKFSFRFNRGEGSHKVEDIEFNNPFGRITADHTKASFIYNKYVYIFEQKTANGEVRLSSELKGVQEDGMKFERYKADRSKEGTITEIKLLTEHNGYPIHYFFLLSGFRLTDERINVICEQIKQTNGKAGMSIGKKGLPRVAGLNYKEFSNYSPFNHILYRDKSPDPRYYPMRLSEDADKKKYFVYLTDAVQLSFKIYTKFLEALDCYRDWQTKEGDERFNKLKNLSIFVEQMIEKKKRKATRFIKDYQKDDEVKVAFELSPIDLGTGYSPKRDTVLLINDKEQRRRIQDPDRLFDTSKWLSYSQWKRNYQEVSLFYYQTALAWGSALLRVFMSEEYMHQVIDYTFGSYQGNGANEYSFDDIETGKVNRDGFDKEEGRAIYSNAISLIVAALSKFEGTTGFVRGSFQVVFSVLGHIYSGDYDMDRFFSDSEAATPENIIFAVFIGKKATAGLAELIDVMVTLNMGTLKNTLLDIKQEKLKIRDSAGRLENAKIKYKKELKILNKYRKKKDKKYDKLKKLWSDFEDAEGKMNKAQQNLKSQWKKVVVRQYKGEILEYINDVYKLDLKLGDLEINKYGELVDIKHFSKKKTKKFVMISNVNKKIEKKGAHKSIKEAAKELKKEAKKSFDKSEKAFKKARKEWANYDQKDYANVKREVEGQESKYKKAEHKFKEQTIEHIEDDLALRKADKKYTTDKKNLKKWDMLSNSLTFFNFIFESVNLGFAIYDTIVSISNDEFTAHDALSLTGSALDFSDSLIDVTTMLFKYRPLRLFVSLKVSSKLLRIGNFVGKLSAGIGVISSGIDCYMDLREVPGNFMEGDSWGVLGKGVAGIGGGASAVASLMVLIGATGGTAGVVIGILVIGGIFAQLGGTAMDYFLGSDQYELWLRHTCWGDEFGRKETTFFIPVDKPDWAVVDFDFWAYNKKIDSEYGGKLGWAGRLDAQLDSFNHLIYYFGFSVSCCRDLFLTYEVIYDNKIGYQKKYKNRMKGGYIEIVLSLPGKVSFLSSFIISIWLEDGSGAKTEEIVKSKRLLVTERGRFEELLKLTKDMDSLIHSRLKECYESDEYLFGNIERKDDPAPVNFDKCLVLRLVDSGIDKQDDMPDPDEKGAHSSYDNYARNFLGLHGKELIWVDRLRDRLADNGSEVKLCISAQLDVFSNGRLLMPQEGIEPYEKVLEIPLSEINEERQAKKFSYRLSEPPRYYYDASEKSQHQGFINKK